MITINGKNFAESEKEFTDSLFIAGGTCIGYAKRYKNKINLQDSQKNLIGVIAKYGVIATASKLDNGKYWYSYGDIKSIGKLSIEEKNKVLNEVSTGKIYDYKASEYAYTFK